MTEFDRFSFARAIAAPAGRVYAALTDAAERQIWGPPGPGMVVQIENAAPAAPGRRETLRCGPADDPHYTVLTDWILLQPPARIVFAETLSDRDQLMGISLVTGEIAAEDERCRLSVTVQITAFGGTQVVDGHRAGWAAALDNLQRHCDRVPA